jgi:hypothetical protein
MFCCVACAWITFQFQQNEAAMDFQEIIKNLNELLGHFLIIFGLSGSTAYGWFRFLGQKWIEQKFSKSLEEFKHEQAKEIAKQQLQIDSIFNRVSKLHDKEYEILPHTWKLLNEAYNRIQWIEVKFHTHPDLNNMTSENLEKFMDKSDLNFDENVKDLMRKQDDKNKLYLMITKKRALKDAYKYYVEFQRYFIENSIFMKSDLKTKIEAIDALLLNLLTSSDVGQKSGDSRFVNEEYNQADGPIKNLLMEISEYIHSRLYPVVQE